MITLFDFITVACFTGLVLVFFLWTDRKPHTLMHFMLPAVVFAVANQLGNEGWALFALILIGAGILYAFLLVRKQLNL